MSTTTEQPTLAELLRDEYSGQYVPGVHGSRDRETKIERPRIIDGLTPKKPAVREGLVMLTPENLLTLRIFPVSVNGKVVGYQRGLRISDAKKAAKWLEAGKRIPSINVALDGNGRLWIVDGQHRAVAAIIARVPIRAEVEKLDRNEQKELFLSQRHATRVNADVLTLASTDPIARYVQQAVSDSGNPWAPLVSARRDSKTKMSPYNAYRLLLRYVYNVEAQKAQQAAIKEDGWDSRLADELASLIACFGTKQTNPLAYRPSTLQAIGATAMWVFRRTEPHVTDRERWVEHMPLFQFAQWAHVTTQLAMTENLLDHWNKRLSAARRVRRV